MNEEKVKHIAWMAWKGAANAHRLYPEGNHTFSDYWDAAKGQYAEFIDGKSNVNSNSDSMATTDRKMAKYINLYTIFEKPTDHPDKFVVRRFLNDVPDKLIGTADTLDEARQLVPQPAHNMGRDPDDDPAIVEVWI